MYQLNIYFETGRNIYTTGILQMTDFFISYHLTATIITTMRGEKQMKTTQCF